MTENRPLQPHQAVSVFTTWYDKTLWLPFTEDEVGNITGPGHQNKQVFAAMVTDYDRHWLGMDHWEDSYRTDPDDVSHGWGMVFQDEHGESYLKPSEEWDSGSVAITTIWGIR